jgi:hypothetical protein
MHPHSSLLTSDLKEEGSVLDGFAKKRLRRRFSGLEAEVETTLGWSSSTSSTDWDSDAMKGADGSRLRYETCVTTLAGETSSVTVERATSTQLGTERVRWRDVRRASERRL